MSSWIKSYQALRDHPKTRKLARRVGGIPQAIGHLHCLWWWCLDYAPDGDLARHTHEDIAIACEWEGDPDEIVRHLTECGFLDKDTDGMRVHDWWEYGEALIIQREAHRARAKTAYERSKTTDNHPSDSSLRAVCTQTAGRDRKIDRKKDLTGQVPVDNSTSKSKEPDRLDWKAAAEHLKTKVADNGKAPEPHMKAVP